MKLNLCSGQRFRSIYIYIAMSMVSYRVFFYMEYVDESKGCMRTSMDQLDLHEILHIFKDKKRQIQL